MNIEIANRLVNLRKSSNLSQEALAEKLGISRQAVSKWERAEASPDTDNLILLARLYGVSLDELLQTEDEIPVPEEPVDNTGYAEQTYEKAATQEDIHTFKNSTHHKYFPIDIVIVIAYLLVGSLFNAWHPGWILFLLIPIWHTFMEAKERKNWHIFAYPVVAAFLFFIMGSFFEAWHPGWVIFLTIPVYYSMVSYYQGADPRDEKEKND